MKLGCLYGVGMGPGDPELMTLKAARILRESPVISYFSKAGKRGHAYTTASSLLNGSHQELPLVYPVTTEYQVNDPVYEQQIHGFYEESAERIARHLEQGRDVALLAIGDPFLYGSFMHIFRRIDGRFPCKVVPGIMSMAGCWANAKVPIAWGDDILTVLPGTMDKGQLAERLKATDAAVIMKLGRNLAKVKDALAAAGMLERAIYVEHGTMENERIIRVAEMTGEAAPYFSMIVVPGMGRRL